MEGGKCIYSISCTHALVLLFVCSYPLTHSVFSFPVNLFCWLKVYHIWGFESEQSFKYQLRTFHIFLCQLHSSIGSSCSCRKCHVALCTLQRSRNTDIVAPALGHKNVEGEFCITVHYTYVYGMHSASLGQVDGLAAVQFSSLPLPLFIYFWIDSSLGAGRRVESGLKKL